MSTLKFLKVTSLPSTFLPSTVYLVTDTETSLLDIYVSNSDGSAARSVLSHTNVLDMIAAALDDYQQATAPKTFIQSTPSDEWTISHDFSYHPEVHVVDSAGSVVFGHVTYPALNQVKILFSVPFSGEAVLS